MFTSRKLAVLLVLACAIALFPASFAATTTYSNLDTASGWDSCTVCAAGGAAATYWMKQGVTSPSMDGKGAQFFVGGTTPFSHGLWWKRLSSNTTATHFVFDMYYYMKEPKKSGGLEFAVNQNKDDKWYKFSTQCSWNKYEWRVWNSKYGGWVGTGVACNRPAAYQWQHLVFEYARSNGKAVFVSITVNGTKHYINKSFYPQSKSGSGSVGMHFQLNGDSTQQDYMVWADKMKVTIW